MKLKIFLDSIRECSVMIDTIIRAERLLHKGNRPIELYMKEDRGMQAGRREYKFNTSLILCGLKNYAAEPEVIKKIARELENSDPAVQKLNRIFQRAAEQLFYIFTLPLYLFIYGLTAFFYRNRPEDIIYSQIRYGRGTAPFIVYKFTTMVSGAEFMSPEECLKKDINDPRILGWWGRILRRTGLNELPQRRNIKQGLMTVFGPRAYPERTHKKMMKIGAAGRYDVSPGWISFSHMIEYNYNISIEAIAFLDVIYADLCYTRYKVPIDIITVKLMLRVILAGRNK